MFAAPYLVRTRGHVVVRVIYDRLQPGTKRFMETGVYVLCAAVSFCITYISGSLVVESLMIGDVEPRSIDVPRWILFTPLLIGFFFVGCEFVRFSVLQRFLLRRTRSSGPHRGTVLEMLADPNSVGIFIFALVLVLMALGIPVAFGFLLANIVGAFLLMGGWVGIVQLVDNATSLITSFRLVAIPMFVLMGALLFHSGLANRVFDSLDALFGRLPGRLSYITVVGGTTFSALTGSTMANTAMLGSLMVPEMEKRGYSKMLGHRPDYWHWWVGHDHTAVEHGRAARLPRPGRHRRLADRGSDSRPCPGDVVFAVPLPCRCGAIPSPPRPMMWTSCLSAAA